MRWFKSDKDSNDDANSSGLRTINCPHCDFEQEVSPKVELTFCKNCSKIINTKQLKEQAPKASPFKGGFATGDAKPALAKKEETAEKSPKAETPKTEIPKTEKPDPTPPPKEEKPKSAPMFKKPQKPAPTVISDEPVYREEAPAQVMESKEVVCSHCKTSQSVPTIALSSFCKKCGQRINLQDYEIKGKFQGELETRGIICIAEGADVTAEMNVGSAVVNGKLRGNIVSENKVEIKESGIVFGTITSPVLLVDDGAIFVGKAIINPKK